MLLGTTIVPLVLQNTTQLLPTRVVDSLCQSSTIVLSVSSTIITAGDDTVSTSYSIFPVDHYTSQAPGLSTVIVQSSTETADSFNDTNSPDVATTTLSFSDSSITQSRDQSPSEFSPYVVFPATLTSTSHIIGELSSSTTPLSASLYFLGSTFSSQAGPNAPTGGLTFVSQSSMSTVTEQTITTIASSTSTATAMANPVYTCPRDNGMYYSDTTNRVYQLLCNTDELDATIGTTYQSQLQSCVDACSDFEGCIGVSYTATSGSCSYKSSALSLVSSETSDSAIVTDYICPGADGTRLVDTSGSVYEILCNTVFPTSSNITSSLTVNDLASCSEICSGIDDCSGFTFQNGSCTTVSSRNSNNGITRMNVETAILLAKRVAQAVSSGITPYRSTSFVQSLPVDVSQTPSTTLQDMSATFTASSGTVQESGGTIAVPSTIIASSSTTAASSASIPTILPSSADTSLPSSDAVSLFSLSSSAAQDQVASSAISSNPATVSALTISDISVVSTTSLTRSRIPSPGIGTSNGISIASSAPPSTQSLASNDVPTDIIQSSRGPTVVLSSLLLSATQNFPSSTISRAEASTNTAILPGGSPAVTRSGESVIFRPTLATSQTSSVFVGASSSIESSPNTLPSEVVSSSIIVLFSTVSAVSYSTVSAASYFAAPSSLPPETNYSCPSANGEQVQANTGGSYTIGCDEETTGYNALVATAPDFNDCMTYCDQLPSCTAWTYSGSCYLKTGASASAFSFQSSNRGAVSGIRAVPAENPGLPGSSPTDFVTDSSALQITGSAESTGGELGALSTASATPPPSLPSFVEGSTTRVLTEAPVQSSEDLPQSINYQGVTTQLLSSVVDTSSNLASEMTAIATTSKLGATFEATAGDIETTAVDGGSAASLSYPTSTTFTSSVTDDIISPPTTDSTPSLTTNTPPASITIASPSTTCSVYDNLLDICLDAVITPSFGVGGAATVALRSITIVDASTSLGIALSAAASTDIGISVGTGGVEIGASASMGVSPGIGGTQQPTITTSIPSSSCSAGGNALDICIDAAITPSIGIGGNAGIAVGSSSVTLVDMSASLAIAPTLAAGVDIGISTGSSDIALVASATLEANLSLGSNTIGTLPNNTAPTSTANCSAGGNVLNVCVDATITASANAGLDLNLGPSSSALTLLDASVALAPSVGAGLDVGLSVGSSGISLAASASLGVNLGLSAGLNLGSGQSTASPALAASSTITTTNINLLPTSSLALATGLGLSLGQSTASSALAAGLNLGSGQSTANQALIALSTVTTTIINLLPTSSLALATEIGIGLSQSTGSSVLAATSTTTTTIINLLLTSSLAMAAALGTGLGQSSLSASSISSTSSRLSSVSTTTTSKATSTSTRASSTPNLVQSLTGALGRQATYSTNSPNGPQGFTALVR